MADLSFTLVGEGTSDAALVPVIIWLFADVLPDVEIVGYCANQEDLPSMRDWPGRITEAFKARPCDILFVHRDADSAGRAARLVEIQESVEAFQQQAVPALPILPVVPVRMIETWLLADETAIRTAARNPSGRMPLNIPQIRDLERVRDPKSILHALTREASGLGTRRRQGVEVDHVLIARLTASFEPLRQLPAFQAFETDLRRVINEQGWPERLP